MAMNKKAVFASLFVACLMVASFGAIVSEQSSEGSSTHYTDIDQILYFTEDRGQWSAKIINDAVGSEVCNYDPETFTLTFTASCNLRGTSETTSALMVFHSGDQVSKIVVNEGVTVNLAGGSNYKGTDYSYEVILAYGILSIEGEGKLNLTDTYIDDSFDSAAILLIRDYKNAILNITIKELTIVASQKECVVFYDHDGGATGVVKISGSHVLMEGMNAIGAYPRESNAVSVIISDSWVKLIGHDCVFTGKSVSITHPNVHLYASTSYRATDIGNLDDSKIFDYQYISTEGNSVSGLLIPLVIIFSIICLSLIYIVFIYVQRPPWEQEKYEAERAKKKAEAEKKRIEQKKLAEAKKAEAEKKKAADAKKKAAERQAAEEKKAADKAAADKRKAAEAKQKEEARKAAEEKKAKDRADAEKKKAAEKKAAEERKAKEAKEKEEAAKAKKTTAKKTTAKGIFKKKK